MERKGTIMERTWNDNGTKMERKWNDNEAKGNDNRQKARTHATKEQINQQTKTPTFI